MKKILLLTGLILVLAGAGCTPSTTPAPDDISEEESADDADTIAQESEIPGELPYEQTGHGSWIYTNGVDEALVGTWILDSLTIGGQSMLSRGHTLNIAPGATWQTDYSTQEWTGPTHPLGSCTYSGSTQGTFFADTEVDLDQSTDLNGDGDITAEEVVMVNYVEFAKSSVGNVKVDCESEGEVEVSGNNMSLGTGPGYAGGHDLAAVQYQYTMSQDLSTLSIHLVDLSIVYTYIRGF